MKQFLTSVLTLLLFFAAPTWLHAEASLKQNDSMPGYVPKDGFVPDSQTAIAIAVAVLTPIYGEDEINGKRPFSATLKNGKWIVTGSLAKNLVGGVPEVQLSKSSGKILKVSSGK